MNANKVITEAMGKPLTYPRRKTPVKIEFISLPIPDYTDPVHYCALMDWMRGYFNCQLRWQRLEMWLMDKKSMTIVSFLKAKTQEQVNLIAEAIEAGVLK